MRFQYLNKRFDDALVLGALAKIYYEKNPQLSGDEQFVYEAIKRAVPDLQGADYEEVADFVGQLNEEQLAGLANAAKGILHEMQFIAAENADGDQITAAMFTDPNHPDTDVILKNEMTGETWDVQLKATDSSSYVKDWIDDHDEGEILVTEELAAKMELESTGFSNGDLTADVNEFLDKLKSLDKSDELWDYIPVLPAISIAIALFFLIRDYKNGEISFDEFRWLAVKITGKKILYFSIIAILMMIPVVNVVVGATILFNLLSDSARVAEKYINEKIPG